MFVDDSRNVAACGTFRGTADFAPGAGTYSLTSVGFDDPYVAKVDERGSFLWAGSFPAIQPASASAMAGDDEGSVYVGGSFDSDIDVDPDPVATHTLVAGTFANDDTFVVKLDSAGHYVWASQFAGAPSADAYVSAIRVDSGRNVYVTGGFQGTVDFDPDPGAAFNLTSASTSARDAFLVKLDSLGHFL